MKSRKKILVAMSAFVLSFIILSNPIIALADEGNITNDPKYLIKNLSTGEESEIAIPESEQSETPFIPNIPTPFEIIGADERIPITGDALNLYPTSSVGVIHVTYEDQSSTYGTGWLFGPNDVATAAHVLYNDDGYIATDVEFRIGGNTYTGTNIAVPGEYMNG